MASLVGRPVFWVVAMALLAGPPLISGLLRRPPPVPEVLGTLPPFQLTERGGTKVDAEALKGRAWFIGFVDTGCVACAERLGKAFEVLQYRLRNAGPTAALLEVAVPSATPVVDVSQELVSRHANPRLWRAAAGPEAKRLLAEVGLLAPLRGPMLEAGGAVVLVDAQGRVRAIEGTEAPGALNELISKMTLILNFH